MKNKKEIFKKISHDGPILLKDVDIELKPDDEIWAGYEDESESDRFTGAHYYFSVYRLIE